jgi:hypothetical protein
MSNLTLLERLVPMLRFHDTLDQKTDGRIGHQIPGMPRSLLLHMAQRPVNRARRR